jgi:hypothetical protein
MKWLSDENFHGDIVFIVGKTVIGNRTSAAILTLVGTRHVVSLQVAQTALVFFSGIGYSTLNRVLQTTLMSS